MTRNRWIEAGVLVSGLFSLGVIGIFWATPPRIVDPPQEQAAPTVANLPLDENKSREAAPGQESADTYREPEPGTPPHVGPLSGHGKKNSLQPLPKEAVTDGHPTDAEGGGFAPKPREEAPRSLSAAASQLMQTIDPDPGLAREPVHVAEQADAPIAKKGPTPNNGPADLGRAESGLVEVLLQ